MNLAERIIRVQNIEKETPFNDKQVKILECTKRLSYFYILNSLSEYHVNDEEDIKTLESIKEYRELFIKLTKGK